MAATAAVIILSYSDREMLIKEPRPTSKKPGILAYFTTLPASQASRAPAHHPTGASHSCVQEDPTWQAQGR